MTFGLGDGFNEELLQGLAAAAPMMELDRKRAHMDATSNLKGRDASGRARRS